MVDVLIVFATNLQPESLADEAFLRRIPYKIRAKNPTTEEYARIFELNCKKRGLLDDTLIIWGGEFGRTPMSQGGDGRDHHIKGFSYSAPYEDLRLKAPR